MPHASTPANRPSADTPTHTAPGNSTANGAARRATCSSPIARAATRTAAAADAPTAITSSPAAPPPPSPIRSSTTKTRNAPGGWAPTCVVQNHVWSGSTAEVRMCPANSRSSTGSAGAPGTSCRYSSADVRRSTTPRCHPSTSASASVHKAAATPVSAGSARHGRRSAHAGPRATTTTATTTATGVPGPTWGSHCASSGGNGRYRVAPSARRRRPTAAAATTSAPAAATTTRSAHHDRRNRRIPPTGERYDPVPVITPATGAARRGRRRPPRTRRTAPRTAPATVPGRAPGPDPWPPGA